MKDYTKEEVKKILNNIFEFIDNKTITNSVGEVFEGHPNFYFFHSKEELNNEIENTLTKEIYNKYDIYYISNKLIKFMLDKYDSHTTVYLKDYTEWLPIKFNIKDNKVYMTNISPDINIEKGLELIQINDIDIKDLLKEIEEKTCYSTKEWLYEEQAKELSVYEDLLSLPSIKYTNKIEYKFSNDKKIVFDINNLPKYFKTYNKNNYYYEVIDNILVINYSSCKEKEKMNELIDIISNINVEGYIIDIRNNRGGDSSIIKPLIEFLKDKNVVVLVNEKVFSSGRMAYIDLKNIGAYSIGTNISTSLNAFGNTPGELVLDDPGLVVKRSSTYWYYDDNYNCIGYNKNTFTDYFKDKKELLEPKIIEPDEYVKPIINDIINDNDIILEKALEYFEYKKTNNRKK